MLPSTATRHPVQVLPGTSAAVSAAARGIAGVELLSRAPDGVPEGALLLVELEAVDDVIWQRVRAARPDGRGVMLVGGAGLRARLSTLFDDGAVRHVLITSGELDPVELSLGIERLCGRADADGCLESPTRRDCHRVRQASQKASVVENAGRFARAAGVSSRHAGSFCTVVEELVTNAVYNAPVDAEGRARFAALGRNVEVQLEPKETVDVELAFDDQRLAVRVTDRFGSLTAQRLQASMARCLRKGKDQIARGDGGAGIGLYYSWELLSRLTVEIAAGKCTRVCGVIDTRGTHRDFAQRAKSFDVFVEGEVNR